MYENIFNKIFDEQIGTLYWVESKSSTAETRKPKVPDCSILAISLLILNRMSQNFL
jgi:hypothetical protein